MFINRKKYEDLKKENTTLQNKVLTLEEDKRVCEVEIQNLTEKINSKIENCQMGVWCRDCKHRKTACTEGYIAFIDAAHAYRPTTFVRKTSDYIEYCAKYIHESCPGWEGI